MAELESQWRCSQWEGVRGSGREWEGVGGNERDCIRLHCRPGFLLGLCWAPVFLRYRYTLEPISFEFPSLGTKIKQNKATPVNPPTKTNKQAKPKKQCWLMWAWWMELQAQLWKTQMSHTVSSSQGLAVCHYAAQASHSAFTKDCLQTHGKYFSAVL